MDQQIIAAALERERVRCGPLPQWVEYYPHSLPEPNASDAHIANGLSRLLQDIQIDLTGPEHARYIHTAQRVLTRAGAERASHFAAEFDPSFERIDVHFVRVIRGSERLDHARTDAFQMLRRESNLEHLILDGRLTASLLIPDVRENDIVEIGMTVYGSNPALGGKYCGWMGFDFFVPWYDVRYRLLRPLAREIAIKEFNDPPKPVISVADGIEDAKWLITGQKRREGEELTPPWLILVPAMQLSEVRDWNEVARLFAPLYETATIPDALVAEIDDLAAKYAGAAERAAEWLRFVQQHLRYFALSLGEGGLVPRTIDTIWSSRFGDCKDAARLYVAGARRLGLDACAALTSTTHGIALNTFLPSHSVFNHCIVRLRLDNAIYWLDPTMQVQGGSLDNIYQPHAGWALALITDSAALEKLPDEQLHFLNCNEVVTFGQTPEQRTKLRREIEHFHWVADALRRGFKENGTSEYASQALKRLQGHWRRISESSPVEVQDDSERNCITIILNYDIRDCWETAGSGLAFTIADTFIPGELAKLTKAERRCDLYLGRPRKMTRNIHMKMPRRWSGKNWQTVKTAGHIRLTEQLEIKDHAIFSSRELSIDSFVLPAADTEKYTRLIETIGTNYLNIYARTRFGKLVPPGHGMNFNVDKAAVHATLSVGWLLLIMLINYYFLFH